MEINITSSTIEQTQAYQKMDGVQKILVKKLPNVKKINHHLNVIKNIGLAQWKKQSDVNYLNKLIIKEIYNEPRK